MSVSLKQCAASVKQMEAINSTLKQYGTRYLLPQSTEASCLYGYFCQATDCPHHSREYFNEILYPYEHYTVVDGLPEQEHMNLTESVKRICKYYGLFDLKGASINNDKAGGVLKHMWDDNRTMFSREYDRIICTTAFRHLQYKTQVMVNSASDDQRTRLLHSLEVQKVAKKIAMGIHANWELAETIAIAHDIGHTPFGHEGESIIKDFLQDKKSGVFSHALQSVKVLDELAEHPILNGYDVRGLGLSDYVLEGVLKHDSDTFTDGMLNDDFIQQYNVANLCEIVGMNNDDYIGALKQHLKDSCFVASDIKLPQVLIGSVESQIVAWADKIAYLGHDWEEFIDTGLLEKMMSRINDMVLSMEAIAESTSGDDPDDHEAVQIRKIWKSLQNINNAYMGLNQANSAYACEKWDEVSHEIETILCAIEAIEENCIEVKMNNTDGTTEAYCCHQYFSAREYSALKNYLVMTSSWVNLLGVYPRTYGMKNDPIYVFYQYLTQIRSRIITPRVTDCIIKQTNNYVDKIDPTAAMTRDEYLLHCNKKWAYKYAYVNRKMLDCKKARKCLKKTLRTCFLVGFHDEVENDETYIVGLGSNSSSKGDKEQKSKYDFASKYNCLLYIFDFIGDEFIKSTRVKFMKHTAQDIIRTLLEYYYDHPDMLPFDYRNRYNKRQYALAMKDNIPEITDEKYTCHANQCKARIVADYVANMTDRMAKLKYDEIKSSDTRWSNAYGASLT